MIEFLGLFFLASGVIAWGFLICIAILIFIGDL
jgi:hypothetical protein